MKVLHFVDGDSLLASVAELWRAAPYGWGLTDRVVINVEAAKARIQAVPSLAEETAKLQYIVDLQLDMVTESLMTHVLSKIPLPRNPYPIAERFVSDGKLASRLATAEHVILDGALAMTKCALRQLSESEIEESLASTPVRAHVVSYLAHKLGADAQTGY